MFFKQAALFKPGVGGEHVKLSKSVSFIHDNVFILYLTISPLFTNEHALLLINTNVLDVIVL